MLYEDVLKKYGISPPPPTSTTTPSSPTPSPTTLDDVLQKYGISLPSPAEGLEYETALRHTAPKLLEGEKGISFSEFQPTAEERMKEIARRAVTETTQRIIGGASTVLDYLNIGQYAVVNVLQDLLEKYKPELAQRRLTVELWDVVRGNAELADIIDKQLKAKAEKGIFETILEAAREGITLERKGDMVDLLQKWFPPSYLKEVAKESDNPVIDFIAEHPELFYYPVGMAANILLDPTTYVEFGAVVKGKRAFMSLGLGSHRISVLPSSLNESILKRLNQAYEVVNSSILGRLFSPAPGRGAEREFASIAFEAKHLKRGRTAREIEEIGKLSDKLLVTAKKLNIPEEELLKALEKPSVLEKMPQEIKDIVANIRGKLNNYIFKEAEIVKDLKPLSSEEITYLPHYFSDDFRKYLARRFGGDNWLFEIETRLTPTHKRAVDMTLDQIEEAIRKGQYDLFGKDLAPYVEEFVKQNPGKKIMNHNLKSILLRRAGEHVQITTTRELLETALNFDCDTLGIPKTKGRKLSPEALNAVSNLIHEKELVEAGEVTEEVVKSLRSALANKVFPHQIADILEKTLLFTTSSKEVNEFLKLYDTATGIWKHLTLAYYPGWTLRNFLGNLWFMYLADVKPQDALDAFKILLAKDTDTPVRIGKVTLKAKDIYREAQELDVLSGLYANVVNISKRALSDPVSKAITVFNSAHEEWARLACYLHYLREGNAPREAARLARRAMVDYAALTEFERNVAERLFPFYAFYKGNLIAEVVGIVQRPRKATTPVKMLKGLQDIAGVPEGMEAALPTELREAVPIMVSPGEYIIGQGLWPLADVLSLAPKPEPAKKYGGTEESYAMQLMRNIAGEFGQKLHPVFRTFMAFLYGRDPDTGVPLEGKVNFLGIDMDAKVAYALKSIRELGTIDRLFGGKLKEALGGVGERRERALSEELLNYLVGIKKQKISLRPIDASINALRRTMGEKNSEIATLWQLLSTQNLSDKQRENAMARIFQLQNEIQDINDILSGYIIFRNYVQSIVE